MAFALRMNLVDAISDHSLKNTYINGKKSGYQFEVRLNYYRGHYLSDIEEFEVTVDGLKVKEQDIKFCINEKEFDVCQLGECYTEFWTVLEPATVRVYKKGGLSAGEHKIDFKVIFRSPYMPIGPDHQYMCYDGSGIKTLPVLD
ncbi:MAG TPA: hypothetical protein GXX75_18650 [Clostridiales bacterium]|nr:hypothetical protein [Clostridiales bacterium]